jgi:hypothetical protein
MIIGNLLAQSYSWTTNVNAKKFSRQLGLFIDPENNPDIQIFSTLDLRNAHIPLNTDQMPDFYKSILIRLRQTFIITFSSIDLASIVSAEIAFQTDHLMGCGN